MQDGRFSIYINIFTKYIKITAFRTSPVEKQRNRPLNFKFQASNTKFQEETFASFRQKQE